MINPIVVCMPVFNESFTVKGFRACIPSVPGCFIKLQDRMRACEIISQTAVALLDEVSRDAN